MLIDPTIQLVHHGMHAHAGDPTALLVPAPRVDEAGERAGRRAYHQPTLTHGTIHTRCEKWTPILGPAA